MYARDRGLELQLVEKEYVRLTVIGDKILGSHYIPRNDSARDCVATLMKVYHSNNGLL